MYVLNELKLTLYSLPHRIHFDYKVSSFWQHS